MDDLPHFGHVVEDHPREAEVDEIWAQLSAQIPPELTPIETIGIVEMSAWFPTRFQNHLSVPIHALAETTTDQLAFAIAHAATQDFIAQFLDDAAMEVPNFPPSLDRLPVPARDTIAKVVGTAEGIAAVGRSFYATITQSRERETARIREAVTWVHRAGYDPNACVRYFLGFDRWLDERQAKAAAANPSEAPNNAPIKAKVGAMLLTPFLSALHEATKDSPPVAFGADHAALARTICVELGYYPPR